MMTEEWTLFPGRYRVTLTGSGFDHSYIYARYGLINEETYKLDIDFTGIDPNEMTFEFTATEMLHYGAPPSTRWTTQMSPSTV